MGALIIFSLPLIVYSIVLWKDYSFGSYHIGRYADRYGLQVLSKRLLWSDDGINPFLRNSEGIRITYLVNGRPEGKSFRYFLVNYKVDDQITTFYVEVERRIFGQRSVRFAELEK